MTTLAANTDIDPSVAQPAAQAKPPVPIRWRQALLTGLAVYPFITLYILVLFPFTEGWAIWQRTLLLVPIMVLTMVYVISPVLQKRFGGFIVGRAPLFGRK